MLGVLTDYNFIGHVFKNRANDFIQGSLYSMVLILTYS